LDTAGYPEILATSNAIKLLYTPGGRKFLCFSKDAGEFCFLLRYGYPSLGN